MSAVKFGVVGVKRGMTYIKLLKTLGDVACLHAICDIKPANAREPLPENVKIYADYDEFLDSGIDAVVLCNCFHEHASLAVKALKKNIHVLSEGAAAATLAECVELCRTAEKSNAKYMLGANVPFKRGLLFMKDEVEKGRVGNVFYAEAEYMHFNKSAPPWTDGADHWRRKMPGTYYNMHTLAPLMHMTGTVPRKVTAVTVRVGDRSKTTNSLIDHDGAKILCEMDNGARFDFTACAYWGPTSKWFRLVGDKGILETERYDSSRILFVDADGEFIPDEPKSAIEIFEPGYADLNIMPSEELASYTEEQIKLGHSGIDLWMLCMFIKYINGEYEPFFDVYRASSLAAAGILAWRSIQNRSVEYDIPDFTSESQRSIYEDDFYSPFADKDSKYYVSGYRDGKSKK